jgi:hypothetical protein
MQNTAWIPHKIVYIGLVSLLSWLPLYSEVEWSGTSVKNVVNKDLLINADVQLPVGATSIEASKQDVDVTLARSLFVQGNSGGESQLYLEVSNGKTITFHINHDLSFYGSSSGAPLVIIQRGDGQVVWDIVGGSTVEFTSIGSSGGTLYYIITGAGTDYAGASEALFQRADLIRDMLTRSPNTRDQAVNIVVGNKSVMGFLSPTSTFTTQGEGAIIFDPTNTESGRMILTIQDGGLVLIGTRHVKQTGNRIVSAAIDPADIIGGRPTLEVVNSVGSDATAGLLVINENRRMSEFLIDPFASAQTQRATEDRNETFHGQQWGMVFSANGILRIEDYAYLDYVGLASNAAPVAASDLDQIVKYRNPSALIFDGSNDPHALPVQVFLGNLSALYFRSGIANNGTVRGPNASHAFTVNPDQKTPGAGNFVLDVEGPTRIIGPEIDGANLAKIEVLSLEVDPTGGSVFIEGTETNFPIRTFAKDPEGQYRTYNSAALFINNHLIFSNASLMHTDQNHTVLTRDDINSEPTYVGGESFLLRDTTDETLFDFIMARPKIEFINGRFLINTDVALTGVDILIPNHIEFGDICMQNLSELIAYQNGFVIDNGTGRNIIFGTDVGSTSVDGTLVDHDAHLDIMQTTNCAELTLRRMSSEGDQTLFITNAPNNNKINENITENVSDQLSTHAIYLGHTSNISVGTDADTTGFDFDTTPMLKIAGNFFAIDGNRGGIFVDLNGAFTVSPTANVTLGVSVAKTRNGIIDLPIDQVIFEPGEGIIVWEPDLQTPDDTVLVDSGEVISDFIIDWTEVKKNFTKYVPYNVAEVSFGACPPVTEENITLIPTIRGEVEQLQIRNSRFGDPAIIKIDGGFVRELVFLPINDIPGSAPVAIIVLEHGGRIGIGSADRNVNSVNAATVIGRNGVMIITNTGGGEVILNDSVSVEGLCPFLFGPGADLNSVLTVTSSVPNELLAENTGVLDMRSLITDREINISGEVQLNMEPGSMLLMGGGTLRFSGNSELNFEPSSALTAFFNAIPLGPIDNSLSPTTPTPAASPHNQFAPLTNYGQGLQNTDRFRTRLIGTGTIAFNDNATALLPQNAIVGIETIQGVLDASSQAIIDIPTTDLLFKLEESSQFLLGDEGNFIGGGALQIGNVTEYPGHSVSWTLEMNGTDAEFVQGAHSFVGLGVGLVRTGVIVPNELLVDTLFNVGDITINEQAGDIIHNRIFRGDEIQGSLLAIGDTDTARYSLQRRIEEPTDPLGRVEFTNTRGGGNLVLVNQADESNGGAIAPIVTNEDDEVTVGFDTEGNPIFSTRYNAGILASTLLRAPEQDIESIEGTTLFEGHWKTLDAIIGDTSANGLANTGSDLETDPDSIASIRAGTVANGLILRQSIEDIISTSGGTPQELRDRALDLGAIAVGIDATTMDTIVFAINLD